MKIQEQFLQSILVNGGTPEQIERLIESYRIQRQQLCSQQGKIELLQEMIQDLAIRNSQLDFERRTAQADQAKKAEQEKMARIDQILQVQEAFGENEE